VYNILRRGSPFSTCRLYITDVILIFQSHAVTRKLCADDIKLYSCYTTNSQSVHDLSEAMERVSAWSQTWQLQLAVYKCFALAVKNSEICSSDHACIRSVIYAYCTDMILYVMVGDGTVWRI
jgi:hypothetical protein